MLLTSVFLLIPDDSGEVLVLYATINLIILGGGASNFFYITKNSIIFVTPIFLFLCLVWIIIMGDDASSANKGKSAYEMVAYTSLKLLCYVSILVFILSSFRERGPLNYIKNLLIPINLKYLLLNCISLFGSAKQATHRARNSLVSANIISNKRSFKNMLNALIYIKTIWIFMLSLILDRTHYKWYVEPVPEEIKSILYNHNCSTFTTKDCINIFLLCTFAVVMAIYK